MPSYEELAASVAKLRESLAARDSLIAELQRLLEEARRAGKRQSVAVSKGEPSDNPARPGRKKGRAMAATAIAWPRPTPNASLKCRLLCAAPAAAGRPTWSASPSSGRPSCRSPARRRRCSRCTCGAVGPVTGVSRDAPRLATLFTYDPAGRVLTETAPGAAVTRRTWTTRGEVSRVKLLGQFGRNRFGVRR